MTERQKTLVWKRTQAHRDRFGKSQTRAWYKTLMSQIQPVLREVSPENLDGLETRIPALMPEDPILDQLTESTITVGTYFAKQTFNAMSKAMGGKLTFKLGGLPTDDQFIGHIKYLLGKQGGKRITSITGESRDQAIGIIRSTLQEGATLGLGTSQTSVLLRDNLNEQWGKISTYRASRIARTETTFASNMGSLVGAKETEEPMEKVWLSTRDSRTRRRRGKQRFDHYGKFPTGPDGEKAELDRPFMKTGESLEYPGDYSGSAGNVIHCRCTVYYEPKISDGGGDIVEPPIDVKPPKPKPVPPKPPPEKPGGRKYDFTRKEKIAEAKKRLANITEEGANAKKLAALEKKIEPLQIQYDTWDHYLREEMGKLVGATGVERERIYAKVLEYQKKRAIYADDLIKLGTQRAKLKKMGMADDVANILGLGDDGNINIQSVKDGRVRAQGGIITSNGRNRTKEADIFRKIMGDVDEDKYVTDCKIFSSKKNKRAFSSGDTAYAFVDDGAETVCHELGHAMEHQNAFMAEKSRTFLEMRCQGDGLTEYFNGSREWIWEDKFLNGYTGKCYARGIHQYPGQGGKLFSKDLIPAGRSEAFSMWWTEVIQNPSYFVLEDPHHFEYFYDMILEMQGVGI